MSVSFEAIGQQYVTFDAAESAAAQKPCKLTANGTVGVCGAGDGFFGVISRVDGGVAGVIMGGYVELPYSGTTAPTLGYCALAADGAGGVKTAEGAREYLVCLVDTAGKRVGLFL